LLEPAFVPEDVVDDPAEERDVRAGADGDVDVGHGAGPGEPGIDVNDGCSPSLRLHDPAEPDGVTLGEVRTLDDDAVSVLEILLEGGGSAPSERDPQTGDRGAVSYTGLVLDLDHAQGREQLLDEVVLLVVEGGPAEMGHGERAVERLALVVLRLPMRVASLLQALGDHLHGALER